MPLQADILCWLLPAFRFSHLSKHLHAQETMSLVVIQSYSSTHENVSIIACEATCQGCQGGLQWGERSVQLRHRLAANHLQEGNLTSHSVYLQWLRHTSCCWPFDVGLLAFYWDMLIVPK